MMNDSLKNWNFNEGPPLSPPHTLIHLHPNEMCTYGVQYVDYNYRQETKIVESVYPKNGWPFLLSIWDLMAAD